MNLKGIATKIPADLYKWLQTMAKRKQISLCAIVRDLIYKYYMEENQSCN